MTKSELYCYFCGTKEKEVNYLIEGDEAFICDYCVDKANSVISENNSKSSKQYGKYFLWNCPTVRKN